MYCPNCLFNSRCSANDKINEQIVNWSWWRKWSLIFTIIMSGVQCGSVGRMLDWRTKGLLVRFSLITVKSLCCFVCLIWFLTSKGGPLRTLLKLHHQANDAILTHSHEWVFVHEFLACDKLSSVSVTIFSLCICTSNQPTSCCSPLMRGGCCTDYRVCSVIFSDSINASCCFFYLYEVGFDRMRNLNLHVPLKNVL